MASTNDGGPAFPAKSSIVAQIDGGLMNLQDYGAGPHPGMSLRQYYAAQVLPQLVMLWGDEDSQGVVLADLEKQIKLDRFRLRVCKEALKWADAMIAAELSAKESE